MRQDTLRPISSCASHAPAHCWHCWFEPDPLTGRRWSRILNVRTSDLGVSNSLWMPHEATLRTAPRTLINTESNYWN